MGLCDVDVRIVDIIAAKEELDAERHILEGLYAERCMLGERLDAERHILYHHSGILFYLKKRRVRKGCVRIWRNASTLLCGASV